MRFEELPIGAKFYFTDDNISKREYVKVSDTMAQLGIDIKTKVPADYLCTPILDNHKMAK